MFPNLEKSWKWKAIVLVASIAAFLRWICLGKIRARQKQFLPQSRISPIAELPLEILLEIAELLPPISKLCFALSCKSLMNTLDGSKALQRSPKFQHPQDLLTPLHFFKRKHIFQEDRWQLLRQLEDPYWHCCSGCLKLHPTSEFTADDLATDAEKWTCKFGPLVGIVHLCPCIKMTFRDKLKLVSVLKQFQSLNAQGAPYWHQCSYDYCSVTVQIKVRPMLEKDGNVLIKSTYTLLGIRPYCNLIPVPQLCCPPRSLFYHIRDLLDPQSTGRAGYTRPMICRWCQTIIEDAKWTDSGYDSFTILRRLGNGTFRADKAWYKQTDVAFGVLDAKGRRKCWPWKSWL
ncbi:hypothetical protein VTN96DRAFT_364 [Rasamsonia emersonii]